MTIKRQYSLPNCKLIVEGVGDESLTVGAARPSLSMVVNVECHFIGHEKPLTGGQEFLVSLVKSTTDYAQQYLSGITHPASSNNKAESVQIQRFGQETHRLIAQPQSLPDQAAVSEPTQIDLQTVQLFDLVEAIDQLCADTQTLPDLAIELTPLPKRYVRSQEPVSKRAVPAVIGISGLAVASALLFMVPVPEVRRPEPARAGAAQESPIASPTGAGSPNGSGTPDPSVSPDAASSPDAVAPAMANPTPTVSASLSSSPDANAAEVDSSNPTAATILETAPAITDANQVSELTQELRSKLDEAWSTRPTFQKDLVYRVGVSANGDILGFDYENDAALKYRNEVPLLDLLYAPTDAPTEEPIATFRVVFTPQGVVQVSSWDGQSSQSSP